MRPTALLQAVRLLPPLDRERVDNALARDMSARTLLTALRDFSPMDDDWRLVAEFAREILAEDAAATVLERVEAERAEQVLP